MLFKDIQYLLGLIWLSILVALTGLYVDIKIVYILEVIVVTIYFYIIGEYLDE